MNISNRHNAVVHGLLGLCLCAAGQALADEAISYKFSGFGTVGAVVTNTDLAQFRSSGRQSNGATTSPDLGVDSRLGLQVNASFNDTFSAVGQLLTGRRDGSEMPQVEWLFVQAAATPWLDVRLGRMVLPTFMVSDTRSVGYAQVWLRAPQEAYQMFPPSSFDGVMASMHDSFGDTNVTLQLSAGKSDTAKVYVFDREITMNYGELFSLNLTAERGNWLLRYGRTTDPDLKPEGLPFAIPKTKDTFSGLGVQYDNGQLVVLSEYLTRRTNTGMFDTNSYYFSAGYRLGALTPYVIVSRMQGKGTVFNSDSDSHTNAVGMRWDLMKNAALKMQLERVFSRGQLVNAKPAFNTDPSANVLSVALDFVF